MRQKLIPFLQAEAMARYAEAVSGRMGFTITFIPGADTAYTTPSKEIVIPAINKHSTIEDLIRSQYFIIHECLHWTKGAGLFSMIVDTKLNMTSKLGQLLNIFEDYRIETAGAKDFRGDAEILAVGRRNSLVRLASILSDPKIVIKEDGCKLGAALFASIEAMRTWNAGADLGLDEVIKLMPKEIGQYRQLLDKFDIQARLIALPCDNKGYEKAYELAQDVYKLLYPREDISQNHLPPKDNKGTPDKEGKDGKVPYDIWSPSQHTRTGTKTNGPKFNSAKLPPPDLKHRFWTYDKNNVYILDYKKEIDRYVCREGLPGSYPSVNNNSYRVPALSRKLAGVANKMRIALQAQSHSHYRGNRKRGHKLHYRSTFKAAFPPEFAEYRERIWRTKEVSDILDTAVALNIDMSGSMAGSRLKIVINTVRIFQNVLCKVLQMALEVTLYSSVISRTIIGVAKPFTTHLTDAALYSRMKLFFNTYNGGTPSGPALMVALDRLRQRPEPRKILFHITDGGANGQQGACAMVQDVAKAAQLEGIIEVYGIGIETPDVNKLFDHYVIIPDVKDIAKILTTTLTQHLIQTQYTRRR